MKNYFKSHSDIPFRRPNGIRLIPVDSKTGIRANIFSDGVIKEAFKSGQIPENIKTLNYSKDKILNTDILEGNKNNNKSENVVNIGSNNIIFL